MTNDNSNPKSKRCTECNKIKPVTEFYRAKRGLFNRYSKCKECKNALTRQYLSSPTGKKARVRANKKYYQTPNGKEQKAKDQRIYVRRYPDKHRAHTRVGHAIMRGSLPKATDRICVYCGESATEYHHHNGYSINHYLDVIPLCKPCHQTADA